MNEWFEEFKKRAGGDLESPHHYICLKCGFRQITKEKIIAYCERCKCKNRLGFKNSELTDRPMLFRQKIYCFNVVCLICRKGFNPMNKYELLRAVCPKCNRRLVIGEESIISLVCKNRRNSPFVKSANSFRGDDE
jgi:DNA-directed RNA polymerase subunit RPC12/RpoP